MANHWRRISAPPGIPQIRAPRMKTDYSGGRERPGRRLVSATVMARTTTVHVCSSCGHSEPRWMGQCPGCGEWNTLVEERAPGAAGGRSGGTTSRGRAAALRPVPLAEVPVERVPRLAAGIGELDRVLGGGLVPGSLVLLGGAPG